MSFVRLLPLEVVCVYWRWKEKVHLVLGMCITNPIHSMLSSTNLKLLDDPQKRPCVRARWSGASKCTRTTDATHTSCCMVKAVLTALLEGIRTMTDHVQSQRCKLRLYAPGL